MITHNNEIASRARRVIQIKDGRIESDSRQGNEAQSANPEEQFQGAEEGINSEDRQQGAEEHEEE